MQPLVSTPPPTGPAGPSGTSPHEVVRHDPVPWSDPVTVDVVQLLVDSLVEVGGLRMALVALVGADGRLRTVAAAGEPATRDAVIGTSIAPEGLLARLGEPTPWGYAYVRLPATPEEEQQRDPRLVDWRPERLLLAPLYDGDHELQGSVAVELADDRELTPDQQALLQRFAVQAGRTAARAAEGDRLRRRLELADQHRDLVRRAAAMQEPADVLALAADDLAQAYDTCALWVRLYDDGPSVVRVAEGAPIEREQDAHQLARAAAEEAWARGGVGVLYADGTRELFGPSEAHDRVVRWVASRGCGSVALVPLGVDGPLIGSVTMVRGPDAPRWTRIELDALAGLGRDLGDVVAGVRAFADEARLVDELRVVGRYRNQLISTVTAELREPLDAITGALDILGTHLTNGSGSRACASMRRSTRRMAQVIDDLRLLSAIDAPDRPMEAQAVDVPHLVREAYDVVGPSARLHQLTVSLEVDSADDLVVHGSPTQLSLLVTNLLSNAVKYTPPGGSIRIGVRRVDGQVELAVADTGVGIAPDDQERIFHEFFRSGDEHVRTQPGTGVGLAIVDQVVRRHGGRVTVESAPGMGSTFRVRLPPGAPGPSRAARHG